MKSIVWGNYKGGVGKTTSVFQISTKFAASGKRVLLIDLDPQCSLSNVCCNSNGINLSSFSASETFNYLLELYMRYTQAHPGLDYDLLRGTNESVLGNLVEQSLIPLKKTDFENNLYFIPSSLSFENCRLNELSQRMDRNIFNLFVMHLFLEDLRRINEQFNLDYVFFDCPPTTNLLIQGTFLNSDYYIVPTIIDPISVQGVSDYISQIERTWTRFNMNPDIGAILINKVFCKKPQLIGIFEALYKDRHEKVHNGDAIVQLDKMVSKFSDDISILSQDLYKDYRYKVEDDCFSTRHIFNLYIGHRDNRSGGESIPANTSRGLPTPAYDKLAAYILKILEDQI